MPFRQRLRSAFLKFPCGHGGSQFRSKRKEPELIPPARVYLQPGPSDAESAPPPPAISRIRKIPGVHKNTLNFLGAGGRYHPSSRKTTDGRDRRVDHEVVDNRSDDDGVNSRASGEAGDTKRFSAIGPDDDPSSSLREPGHYDNIGNPVLDPELSQHSQVSPQRVQF